ncbi:MAG TPA: hypothetical protein VG122_06685, partial [Gemmata sp.]|nr:hypothetical protein [Gemmata sp.]
MIHLIGRVIHRQARSALADQRAVTPLSCDNLTRRPDVRLFARTFSFKLTAGLTRADRTFRLFQRDQRRYAPR